MELPQQTLRLRQWDRLPSLVSRVRNDQGQYLTLTGAVVQSFVRRISGVCVLGDGAWTTPRTVSILDSTTFRYDIQLNDTRGDQVSPGVFEVLARVTKDPLFNPDEAILTDHPDVVVAPTRRQATIVLRPGKDPADRPAYPY